MGADVRHSSVCSLLALHTRDRGNIPKGLIIDSWRDQLTKDGLFGKMWLTAYEASRKGWLTPRRADFITKSDFFSDLDQLDITFYDETTITQKIKINAFTREKRQQWANLKIPFDDYQAEQAEEDDVFDDLIVSVYDEEDEDDNVASVPASAEDDFPDF